MLVEDTPTPANSQAYIRSMNAHPSNNHHDWPEDPVFWLNKRVIVTGGGGFLGSFVVQKLMQRGAAEIIVPRSQDYDLRRLADIKALFDDTFAGTLRAHSQRLVRPQGFVPTPENTMLIHLAAHVGGIGANRAHPAEFFYDNIMMGVPLLHEAWEHGLGKFVAIGTVCAYPKYTPVPFKEEDL